MEMFSTERCGEICGSPLSCSMRMKALAYVCLPSLLGRKPPGIVVHGSSKIAGPPPACGESITSAVVWYGPAAPAARYYAARTPATSGSSAPHHPGPASWTFAASGPGTRRTSWLCRADPATSPGCIETTDGCTSWRLLLTNPDATGFLGRNTFPRPKARCDLR